MSVCKSFNRHKPLKFSLKAIMDDNKEAGKVPSLFCKHSGVCAETSFSLPKSSLAVL